MTTDEIMRRHQAWADAALPAQKKAKLTAVMPEMTTAKTPTTSPTDDQKIDRNILGRDVHVSEMIVV